MSHGIDELLRLDERRNESLDDRCEKCGCMLSRTPTTSEGDTVIVHCSNEDCPESKKGRIVPV